jgi:hypothetical protein
MTTQQLSPLRTSTRRADLRRWWWLLAVVVLASAVIIMNTNRVTPAAPEANAALIEQSDPAAPSVMNYIRVHETMLDRTPLDAATQGTLNYIKVHESVPDHVILGLFKKQANGPD